MRTDAPLGGNVDSNTAADHERVLADALAQLPSKLNPALQRL
ncbi:hypothetical protein [Mycobacterium sp.]|nr:hypothetical protein [Mycobacterium sp.]HTQ16962.1 hypothetical protein [Mycobacterium sp.]